MVSLILDDIQTFMDEIDYQGNIKEGYTNDFFISDPWYTGLKGDTESLLEGRFDKDLIPRSYDKYETTVGEGLSTQWNNALDTNFLPKFDELNSIKDVDEAEILGEELFNELDTFAASILDDACKQASNIARSIEFDIEG